MILYTLDINKKLLEKTVIIYIVASILCFVFSFIYLKLSFGVVSLYMKYLTLIPLILGVFIYFIVSKLKIKHSRVSYNLYNASVYTLTVGSIFQGILEICGAHSFYTIIYLIVGIIFMAISFINLIMVNKK